MKGIFEKIIWVIYCFGIFGFLMIFFGLIHPILPFDTDDWLYLYLRRSPFPEWGGWNPTKIFPETFMPICADIAGNVIYKISNNYIGSFKWVNAFVISTMITIYIFFSTKVFKKGLKNSGNYIAIMLGILFFVCHFLIFRSEVEGNRHMFWETSMTSYYHYILPDLLACILVLWMMFEPRILGINSEIEKKGIFVFLLYLSLNSNIFASVIPMAYIGTFLIIKLVEKIRIKQFEFRNYIKVYFAELIFFALWITSQIYEMNGARAISITKGQNLNVGMRDSLFIIYKLTRQINKYFIQLTIITFIVALILVVFDKNKRDFQKTVVGITVCIVLTIAYLVIVCGRCGANYLSRPGVFFGIAFYCLILLMFCLKYVTLRLERSCIWLPLIIFFMLIGVKTAGITFLESNIMGLSEEIILAIDEQIIDQFVEAEKEGKGSITLYVPYFKEGDNFPIAKYGGNRISDSLYFHGVINHRIRVTEVIPDESWKIH